MMKDCTFGNYLLYLRKTHAMTQKDVGKYTGVSERAVSRWERGECRPRKEILPRLAECLGVTVKEMADNMPGGD